ncbi:hypothetical protein EOK75_20240 (plasmid) [Pseudorhodobacter turbinis]|uniref:Transposase DDE domain-containing protein n=1 Tax=Pseudorhodobacter turbinis TaxID=2500533 RepID=A0A4P8ELX6_9RHOB|nr:hypothetical protein [Pseudorhodobacter turbinis]QCO58096.1 hypothetical protein EOK75_20240 [Pseudorhodobacter turbinis]
MWLYELRYQAESWDKLRRVILVVKERADDLLLGRFFLVTSRDWPRQTRHATSVLAHYPRTRQGRRPHGRAEGRTGPGALVDQPDEVTLEGAKAEVGGTRCRRLCLPRGPAANCLSRIWDHADHTPQKTAEKKQAKGRDHYTSHRKTTPRAPGKGPTGPRNRLETPAEEGSVNMPGYRFCNTQIKWHVKCGHDIWNFYRR